ncbi:MAG: hypothetical protein E4G91_07965 [Candidatus Zixiibacteriota bacterium]|nr:MAG: hypothetical protein E4G91_07965 [candidate division Zixibacteria bacterium]
MAGERTGDENMYAIAISLIEPLRDFGEKLSDYLPKLLLAFGLVIAGVVVALLVKWVSYWILRYLGLDKLSEKVGTAQVLAKGGIRDSLALLISKLFSGLVILLFLAAAFFALNVPTSESLFERFLLYIPNVLVALIILIAGFAIGNFLGRAVLIATVNAGIRASGSLAKLTRLGTLLIALTMALEQLGVGRETITVAFAILFGGVVLAIALALGLGGRDLAKKYLEDRFEHKGEDDDFRHI